jgi:predicted lipoprotein
VSATTAPRTGQVRRPATRTIVGAVALVALVVAMVLNTRFLTPEEVAEVNPAAFDPAATAEELFAQAPQELAGQAAPLPDVVTALQGGSAADAAGSFDAVSPNEGSYDFVVTATGTVTAADANSLTLQVEGVPAQTTVTVPLTTAVNGTVLRDALRFRFADAPGQSDFQFVGDELKKLMQAQLATEVGDPASLQGTPVTVVGAIPVIDTGGPQPPAKPVAIQAVSVQKGAGG